MHLKTDFSNSTGRPWFKLWGVANKSTVNLLGLAMKFLLSNFRLSFFLCFDVLYLIDSFLT